jgi:hypothetical protein
MMTPNLRAKLIRGHLRRYSPSLLEYGVHILDPKVYECLGDAKGQLFFRVNDRENGCTSDWQLRDNRLRCIGEQDAIF